MSYELSLVSKKSINVSFYEVKKQLNNFSITLFL